MVSHNMQGEYLRKCLQEFPDICQLKYGVVFDLASVEEKVKHLRRRTPLSYADLEHFKSPEYWFFDRFWVFPPKDAIEPALKKETFDFWNLPGSNEDGTVRKLLYIFKSIELASIILRFIRPEHYSIYSSPIRHMLDIGHGRDLVETYLIYLGNLRKIQKQFGRGRIADVDMALWVLHEKCFGQHRDPGIAKAYNQDNFMLQLRASNLVAPLSGLSEARLASALVDVKPDIAVLIACHYLEILIRKLAKHVRLADLEPNSTLDSIIGALPNYGLADSKRKALWNRLRKIRNACFHDGRLPGSRERQLLIEEINKLESDVDKGIS
jgi:hypothetical protein